MASLSKYLGCYDTFLQLKRRYGLKWSTGTEKIDAFTRFFNNDITLSKMIESLKQARRVLPRNHGDILLFCALTGWRNSECIESIKLIRDPEQFKIYFNEQSQCLEHFKYKERSLRRTKSAYITVVDKSLLKIVLQTPDKSPPTLAALKKSLRHRCPSMQMKWCRKIHASFLHQCGVPDVIIDLVQGRVPRSVLAQHYLLPKQSFKDDILNAVYKLREQIER